MKIHLTLFFIISLTSLVKCGYLTGHHPFPANLISARTLVSGAVGGGPSSGAYSASQLTQTVASSPTQVQSSISTYHPSQYGYNNRGNQGYRTNQGHFTPNQGQSQGQNQGSGQNQGYSQNQGFGQNQGYGQNQGQNYNGYNNIPTIISYESFGYGNQGQGGQSQGQGGQYHGQGQNQGGSYQGQSQQYGYSSGQGQRF